MIQECRVSLIILVLYNFLYDQFSVDAYYIVDWTN